MRAGKTPGCKLLVLMRQIGRKLGNDHIGENASPDLRVAVGHQPASQKGGKKEKE